MKNQFELTFRGAALRKFPRYRRYHKNIDEATAEARRVYQVLDAEPSPVAIDPSHVGLSSQTGAHEAVIYGKGCGADGKRVLYGG